MARPFIVTLVSAAGVLVTIFHPLTVAGLECF